jgi:chromate reductase, NAD(P)H dehydrogenase (quinone)
MAYDLADLPLYNGDVEAAGVPKSVSDLRSAAIMGASPGMTGTARSQSQPRQAFVFTNTYAMVQPEVLVARAHEKFDADGQLTDTATREFLQQFVQRFETWIDRVGARD